MSIAVRERMLAELRALLAVLGRGTCNVRSADQDFGRRVNRAPSASRPHPLRPISRAPPRRRRPDAAARPRRASGSPMLGCWRRTPAPIAGAGSARAPAFASRSMQAALSSPSGLGTAPRRPPSRPRTVRFRCRAGYGRRNVAGRDRLPGDPLRPLVRQRHFGEAPPPMPKAQRGWGFIARMLRNRAAPPFVPGHAPRPAPPPLYNDGNHFPPQARAVLELSGASAASPHSPAPRPRACGPRTHFPLDETSVIFVLPPDESRRLVERLPAELEGPSLRDVIVWAVGDRAALKS